MAEVLEKGASKYLDLGSHDHTKSTTASSTVAVLLAMAKDG